MRSVEDRLAVLQSVLLEVLSRFPDGLSEHELIEELCSIDDSGFGDQVYQTELDMFQHHFLLFHCLYRLRDRLVSEGIAGLDIHCLKVKLVPIASSNSSLPDMHDPLRDYYLDLNELYKTSSEDVEALLNSFWHRYRSYTEQDWALKLLGLDASATLSEIKARYRKLAMEYHPDRGGDKLKFQLINEAMGHLKRLRE